MNGEEFRGTAFRLRFSWRSSTRRRQNREDISNLERLLELNLRVCSTYIRDKERERDGGNNFENLKINEVVRQSVKYNILISLSGVLRIHVTTKSKDETRRGLTDTSFCLGFFYWNLARVGTYRFFPRRDLQRESRAFIHIHKSLSVGLSETVFSR